MSRPPYSKKPLPDDEEYEYETPAERLLYHALNFKYDDEDIHEIYKIMWEQDIKSEVDYHLLTEDNLKEMKIKIGTRNLILDHIRRLNDNLKKQSDDLKHIHETLTNPKPASSSRIAPPLPLSSSASATVSSPSLQNYAVLSAATHTVPSKPIMPLPYHNHSHAPNAPR
jgi:hypothetical protein